MSNDVTKYQWMEAGGTIKIDRGHENLVEKGVMIVEFADGTQGVWPTIKTQADIEFLYAKAWNILRKRVTRVILTQAEFEAYCDKNFQLGERVILGGPIAKQVRT